MSPLRNTVPIMTLLVAWSLCPGALQAQNNGWKAPETADELENPLEQSERIINAGNQIFQQLCSVCHGKGGGGDGITAAALDPKPANLRGSLVQDQSEGAIFWKIREGRPPMPGFKSQLSDKQVWAVVAFIKSLNNENTN